MPPIGYPYTRRSSIVSVVGNNDERMTYPQRESNPSFLDALSAAVSGASVYNKNDQAAPAVVLWPDKERQWEALLPQLRTRLPLLTFDAIRYAPAERRGPAYWIRCMLAGALAEDQLPADVIPILYLPGVGKADLRGVEECPKPLQPLAELQFRGALWTQRNGKDWTVAAFLQSQDGGLGIAVAADNATKEALLRALPWVGSEAVSNLRKATPLRAAFFDELLNPDEVRRLLLWLNDPIGSQATFDSATWNAFCNLCQRKYGFHPIQDGPISAATKLGQLKGEWQTVWQRYSEAPDVYANLPVLLRQARPVTQLTLFDKPEPYWPQDNEAAEAALRTQLAALQNALPDNARATIAEMEQKHQERRAWIWAKQGDAPLANALLHLATLAQKSQQSLSGATVTELATEYANGGWEVDAAAIAALASVKRNEDVSAVKTAIRTLYYPWLEAGALKLQQAIASAAGTQYNVPPPPLGEVGTCLLFCDALRVDAAHQVAELLQKQGFHVQQAWRLAALPTVTPTAKPAVSPVWQQMEGAQGTDLAPIAKASQSRVTITTLRSLLDAAGYQVLQPNDLGNPTSKAWTEFGAIDQSGHQHGWKLVYHLEQEIHLLTERVTTLLQHGWRQVQIVTDHGWLLLPGGLPKIELPKHLTHLRKGRGAVMKDGAMTDQQTIGWFWDSEVRIAVAYGIGCYEEGKEYEHGGISPQECVIPVLTVTQASVTTVVITIRDISWKRQRCYVQIQGTSDELTVDIRRQPGDPKSSIVAAPKNLEADGMTSLLVTDEELAGQTVIVVVVGRDGSLKAQRPTIVGG